MKSKTSSIERTQGTLVRGTLIPGRTLGQRKLLASRFPLAFWYGYQISSPDYNHLLVELQTIGLEKVSWTLLSIRLSTHSSTSAYWKRRIKKVKNLPLDNRP